MQSARNATPSERTRTRLGTLAIVLFAAAAIWIIQRIAWNQNAHYALIRALAEGQPHIDEWEAETGDKGYFEGHYYAVKPPGLAFFTLPYYLALKVTTGIPANPVLAIWLLNLWGAVLPAVLILVAVRHVAERAAPGMGAAAAVTLGIGTLILPFSTLYFAHVLSAALGFAAFVLLWRERQRPPRTALVLAAGVVAGLAVTVENTLGLVALVLAGYTAATTPRLRRAAVFFGGLIVGALPMFAFNQWAFGSPTRTAYKYLIWNPGESGHDVIRGQGGGFFGIGLPRFEPALEVLFSARGLLVLTPVVAAGAAALLLLWRRGWRAETAAIAAIFLGFLVFNFGYYLSFGGIFGGASPGPRFLIPALPFLAIPLALAYERFPLATSVLAVESALQMLGSTATEVLLEPEAMWWVDNLVHGRFTGTPPTVIGGGFASGWLEIAPFLVCVGGAAVAAYLSLGPTARAATDRTAALVVFAGWFLIVAAGPRLIGPAGFDLAGALALAFAAVVIGVTVARVLVEGGRGALPAAPLVALALRDVTERPRVALAIAAVSLALVALDLVRSGRLAGSGARVARLLAVARSRA